MIKTYNNPRMFDHLVNDITIVFDGDIIPSVLAEGWMEQKYVYDKYNTTKAVERYTVNIAIPRLYQTGIDMNTVETELDERLKFLLKNNLRNYSGSLDLKVRNINKLRVRGDFTEGDVVEFIRNIDSVDNVIYMKEALKMYDAKTEFKITEPVFRNLIQILESFKRIVHTKSPESEEFKCVEFGVNRILYLYKELDPDHTAIVYTDIVGINIAEVDRYTCEDIKQLFAKLEVMMENKCDYLLDYMMEEFWYISSICGSIKRDYKPVTESQNVEDCEMYYIARELFSDLAEDLFGDNDVEIMEESIYKFATLAYDIAKYEISMEASSRIITKGTEKVTKAIGDKSAKSRGMGSSQSKADQVKRGAKIVDDRASGAINKKIDQIINVGKDAKREKIITGKNTFKLGKTLKMGIGIIASSAITYIAAGPLVGAMMAITTALATRALNKNTEDRERKRILLELETELKIVKEKIEDAKGDNAKEQKYQLMRIQANLEKEITRIKHGLRYY